jgi:dolichol-phosphate mannosyltransferase
MANEERDFAPFIAALTTVLDSLGDGCVFLVIDSVSTDRTLPLARELAERDPRYRVVWAPQNRNVVDAYIAGFRAALAGDYEWVVEMDAGLSHDPAAIPEFLNALAEGHDCAFGSRFVPGGSMNDSPLARILFSRGGSIAAWILLGSRMHDMTSGFEAFRREVVVNLVAFPLRSEAHFFQTEVRHLARKRMHTEIPITYRAPSPGVRGASIQNAVACLFHYARLRLLGQSPSI